MNVPPNTETNLPKIVQAIRDLAVGGTNALSPAEIELAAGGYSTTFSDVRCAATSLPVLVPLTPEASASGWYVLSVSPGSFVIGHALAPAGARFRYELRRN